MILLDKPYISEFLLNTIRKNNYQVIQTDNLHKLIKADKFNTVTTKEAVQTATSFPDTLFYSNSENSVGWITENLSHTGLSEKVNLFKNKVAFRDFMKEFYPDYFYQAININDIANIDISSFNFPFIIKPAVGFFSLGVYKVDNMTEWSNVKTQIQDKVSSIRSIFPDEVVDTNIFIIEECITGKEYAIDCYFDKKGNPVILNILKHIFGSESDVSDRVYITSGNIILDNKPKFEDFLKQIGNKANLKNFPCHVEVRVNNAGQINPIEINPLRFGGLCTTADLTWYAYGFNSYEYYFKQEIPDWNKIALLNSDKIFGMVILDNSTGYKSKEIKSFNYSKLLREFEKPLELRKFNYMEYPLFGYLFCETRKNNQQELMQILSSDLKEFVEL